MAHCFGKRPQLSTCAGPQHPAPRYSKQKRGQQRPWCNSKPCAQCRPELAQKQTQAQNIIGVKINKKTLASRDRCEPHRT
jgi:hypothetical protein